jgi:imidazolonepropionase-like amidohydrolase
VKRLLSASAAVLALAFAMPAAAETVAITGGTVAIGDGSAPIPGGTVVIRDGRVVAAGTGVAVPAGARTIDATGRWVTPGIIAGFSRVGLVEVDAVQGTNDVQANGSPFSAAIDVSDAINPRVSAIAVNRAAGIAGAHALFRNALREARDLGRLSGISGGQAADRRDRANDQRDMPLEDLPTNRLLNSDTRRPTDVLLTRFDAAALVPVLTGRQLLMVHVESGTDILQTLALRKEFPNLRLVLVGASEGWTVAQQIKDAGVPVIASPLNDLPEQFEELSATQSNVGRMRQAGVLVAIGMINDNEARQVRVSTQYAGNLVALTKLPGAAGLSWGEALAAITSRPAEAIGMGGELGSLKAGRRADVVIWDGDPLENSSAATTVFIDGVQQPLENRQTRLRDRYRNLDTSQLPKAYQR